MQDASEKTIPGLTFAIPDIHGRYDLLMEAHRRIETYRTKPFWRKTVVFLGDYVDRGPDSCKVIQYLTSRGPRPLMEYVILKGNHEDLMVNAHRGQNWRLWIANGGDATLVSYGWKPYEMNNGAPKSHIDWMDGLPLHYQDEHRIYVHACILDSRAPLEEQPKDMFIWGMYRSDDQGGWRGKHVVHGHHQHEFGPIRRADRTNLDCGAFYTNRLCIGVFDDAIPGGPIDTIDVTL